MATFVTISVPFDANSSISYHSPSLPATGAAQNATATSVVPIITGSATGGGQNHVVGGTTVTNWYNGTQVVTDVTHVAHETTLTLYVTECNLEKCHVITTCPVVAPPKITTTVCEEVCEEVVTECNECQLVTHNPTTYTTQSDNHPVTVVSPCISYGLSGAPKSQATLAPQTVCTVPAATGAAATAAASGEATKGAEAGENVIQAGAASSMNVPGAFAVFGLAAVLLL